MAIINTVAEFTPDFVFKDITPILETILQTDPVLSWIPMGGTRGYREDGRFHWNEQVLTEKSTTLRLDYVAASLAMEVTSTALYRVGDQVAIDGHVDAAFKQIVFTVTAITDIDTLAVAVVVGSGADTNLTAASQVIHRTSTVADGSDPADTAFGGVDEATQNFNVFQLMEEKFTLGEKAVQLVRDGNSQQFTNLMAEATKQHVFAMAYQLYNQMAYGFRTDETTGTGGTYGGINDFIVGAGVGADNIVDGAGGAFTEAMANNLIQQLLELGLPNANNLVLLMGPTNSRIFSALKNTVVSPNEFTREGNFGGNVQTFFSEIPGFGVAQILVDPKMENQKRVFLLDTTSISWVPKPLDQMADSPSTIGATLVNATPPGFLGIKSVIRVNASMKFSNAGIRCGAILNLAS